MKAAALNKSTSKDDPRLLIARAVSAQMAAEAARKFARLAKDKYKQARKAFKEARRKAKQARKKARSATRTFGAVAGKAKKPPGRRAKSGRQIKQALQQGAAGSLRSSSVDQPNHPVAPAPAPPTSKPVSRD